MNWLISLFFWVGILCSLLLQTALAQPEIVEQGEASVQIIHEKINDAREAALSKAQKILLRKALYRFMKYRVTAETFIDQLLDAQILPNAENYIESHRVIHEKISEDTTRLTLAIEARLFGSSIQSALKQLCLPLIKDPERVINVVVLFDPTHVLWKNDQQGMIMNQLKALLDPYYIRNLRLIALTPQRAESKSALEALAPQKLPESLKPEALLVLTLTPETEPNTTAQFFAKATLSLYAPEGGDLLAQTSSSHWFGKWNPEQISETLLNQLTLKWTNIMCKLPRMRSNTGSLVQFKLMGIPGVQEEEQVLKEVFYSDPRWEQIQLKSIAPDYVFYQGHYQGDKQQLMTKLFTLQQPSYNFQRVSWQEGYLALELQWRNVYARLPPYQPVPWVENWFKTLDQQTYAPPYPKLQVPQGPKEAYSLPRMMPVYDYIKSRGDSTVYRILWGQAEMKVKILWNHLGKTNLQPILSLYDQYQNLIKRYPVKPIATFSLEYQLPADQKQFSIRVSDEIGYIEGSVGSYQFMHYVLTVFPEDDLGLFPKFTLPSKNEAPADSPGYEENSP